MIYSPGPVRHCKRTSLSHHRERGDHALLFVAGDQADQLVMAGWQDHGDGARLARSGVGVAVAWAAAAPLSGVKRVHVGCR